MTNLTRIIKYGWRNFWRNLWLSSATMGIMILALVMVAGLLLLNSLTGVVVQELQNKVDVSVYFQKGTAEARIIDAKNALEDLSDVREVRYISENEALDIFRERHSDNAILMESLEELDNNPLQATLNIKAKDTSRFEDIVSYLERSSYAVAIEKINFQENEKVIDKLTSITSNIKTTGLLFTILLGAFVFLVTFNTIRLSIYSSREEISIMKLVGANNWFARGPYIVTGVLYGIFAALITGVVLLLVSWVFAPTASAVFSDINLLDYYLANFFSLTGILLLVGVGLGVVSSFIATRRYLNI